MKHIGDLFKKYQTNIVPPQASVISEFLLVCQEVAQISLSKEQCRYAVGSKTMYITAPSVLKNELLLHKKEVLRALKTKLGKNAPQVLL